jgi:hypothetical protein
MTEHSEVSITIATTSRDHVLLTIAGILDRLTYHRVRDNVIKAALDEPTAVIVDVNALQVPALSAWAVFTSARWHVSVWPAGTQSGKAASFVTYPCTLTKPPRYWLSVIDARCGAGRAPIWRVSR